MLQPIVDLADGHISGYEALSRFVDPDGHPLRPDRVFAEAGELGLATELELAAARSALELLSRLPGTAYLSINFSPATLLDPAAQRLLDAAPAHRLVVELTEHEQVTDYSALRRALAPLRARGVRLAIDDTGAGFASLQHLTHLAPEIVKLDIAFVRNVTTDPTCRAVARAVAGYATDVGALLIAEGIETAEQATILHRLGAHLGQGYHLGRPQPAQTLLPIDQPTTGTDSRAVA